MWVPAVFVIDPQGLMGHDPKRGVVFISLIGPAAIGADASTTVPVAGAVPRALVSALALDAGRAVTPDTLMTRIWDDPPPSARNAIQVAVSKVRDAFGPAAIETVVGSYRLGFGLAQVDVLEIETALSESRRLAAEPRWAEAFTVADTALALQGDEPFQGLSTEWASEKRAWIAEVIVELRVLRANALLELGRAEDADREFSLLQAERPLDERATIGRMRALRILGRQPQAVQEFHRLRQRLVSALGVDPSPEADQVLRSVLGQGLPLSLDRPRVTKLPSVPDLIWGREADVAQILSLLGAGHRLVTIAGVGGIGKTRLAIQVAREFAATRPTSVWFIDVSTATDAGSLEGLIASVLDPGGSDWEGVLADGEHLVVIDNAETVGDAVIGLMDALLHSEDVHVLVTSRRALVVSGEKVVRIRPLDCDGEESPAARMLQALLPPGVDFAPDEASSLPALVRMVDGMPLAIELIAAALLWRSPEEVLGEIGALVVSGTQAPGNPAPGVGAAPRVDMSSVIGWSIAQVPRSSRAALASISVCRGTFSLAAAEAILRATAPEEEPRHLLAGLIDLSLVQRTSGAGEVRLRILEPVRLVAVSHPLVGPWGESAGDAFAEFHLDRMRGAIADLAETEEPFLRLHIHDGHHVPPALEWAWERGRPVASDVLGDALYFWYSIGLQGVFDRWAEIAARDGFDSPRGAVRAISVYMWAVNDGRADEVAHLRAVILRHVDAMPHVWKMRWVKTEADRLRRSGDVAGAVAVRAAGPPTISKRDRASQALFEALIDLNESRFGAAGRRMDTLLNDRLTVDLPVFHLFVLSTRGYLCTIEGELDRAEVLLTQAAALAQATTVRLDFVQVANMLSWLHLEKSQPERTLVNAAASAEALGAIQDAEYRAEIALAIALAADALGLSDLRARAVRLLRDLTDDGEQSPLDPWLSPKAEALLARVVDGAVSLVSLDELADLAGRMGRVSGAEV